MRRPPEHKVTARIESLNFSRFQVDTTDVAPKAAAPTFYPISDAELVDVERRLRSLTDVALADWGNAKHLTIHISVDEVRCLVDRIRASERA